jgi:hypothetical protein
MNHDLQVLAEALALEDLNRGAKGDITPGVAKYQGDHPGQIILDNLFDDAISETEVAELII